MKLITETERNFRIVHAVLDHGMSQKDAAQKYRVSRSLVNRLVLRARKRKEEAKGRMSSNMG